MSVKIEIIEDSGAKRVTSADQRVLLVGRGSKCDVRLDSDVVSSAHLRIKRSRDGLVIQDLDSTNGTFVDGRRIRGQRSISRNESVRLGPDGPRLRFLLDLPEQNGDQDGSAHPDATATRLVSTAGSLLSKAQGTSQSSRAGIALIAAGVPVLALMLMCTFGGILSLFWLADPWDSRLVVTTPRDRSTLTEAVGLVIVGGEFAESRVRDKCIPLATGTAFAISANGHLITNRHVVETDPQDVRKIEAMAGSKLDPKIWVAFGDQQLYEAEVLYTSAEHDMSILKVDRHNSNYFRISTADTTDGIALLTNVYAIGFPGAVQDSVSEEEDIEDSVRKRTLHTDIREYYKKREFDIITTSGTVSNVFEESNGRTWVLHNADINHGNSGGPLCLEDGTVVGINTQGRSDASGVFYSLSLNQLRDDIKTHCPSVRWVR